MTPAASPAPNRTAASFMRFDWGLRWLWLVIIVVSLQYAAIHVMTPMVDSDLPLRIALPASHLALGLFLLANKRFWGMRVVAIGLALNLAVMLANGGLMPVEQGTVAAIGRHDVAELQDGRHVPGTKNVLLARDDTRLLVLSDQILINVPRPFTKAVSAGDVIIFSGVMLAFVEIALLGRRRLQAPSLAA